MGFFSRISKKEAGPSPAKPGTFQRTPPREQWRDSELQRPDDPKCAVKYPYQALDPRKNEIRLLKVFAGQGSAPLCCTLHHTSISKAPADYETISYCWGQSTIKKVIKIDGTPIVVGESAAGVLYRMRSPDSDRVLWIDAICINQDSPIEKTQQVALMGSIYTMGRRNLVWLGDDHGVADECVAIIKTVLTDIRRRTQDFRTMWDVIHSGPFARMESAIDNSMDLAPLSPIFRCEWFFRLWVAQEAALAPDSLCHFGPASFNLVDVLRCAVWLDHADKFLPRSLRDHAGLHRAAKLWSLVDRELMSISEYKEATQDLYNIYDQTRKLECSVPKDKIYALLGMFQSRNPGHSLPLKPVYQGKSDMEVFRDATRLMLQGGKHLELLRVNHYPPPHPDWPSWVVDFARVREIMPIPPSRRLSASDHRTFRVASKEDSHSPNELMLRGIAVDTIKQHTFPVTQELVPDKCPTHYISNILRSVNELVEHLPQAQCEIYKTLLAGTNWEWSEAGQSDLDDYNSFLKYIQNHVRAPRRAMWPSMFQYGEENERATRFFAKFSLTAWTRCFFVTKRGLFGVGPGNMEPTDVVAVLYGSHLPFVLRPVGPGTYRLIGECYVNRIMHGEAVHNNYAHGRRSDVFVLI